MNIKQLFKLSGCRKSQVTTLHAWYWSFRSVYSNGVCVEVTTYTIDGVAIESDAWKKLGQAVGINIIAYQQKRRRVRQRMGVGGKGR
jgi:hypothetical protein